MDILQPQSMIEVPTPEQAATALNNARLKAAVGFEMLVELLTIRGFDPTISTKSALDVSEHLYKVSGMAQKQAVQTVTPTVKFTFNATAPSAPQETKGQTVDMEVEITQEAEFTDTLPDDVLSDIPAYVNNIIAKGNALEVETEDE